MEDKTTDLLRRAEKAVKQAELLRRENELLVASARRLTNAAELGKLRDEIYGPAKK